MKLENSKYLVTFVKEGGEILSFLNKETGMQYMYQGDTPFWGGKNPSLWPLVGNTYDGTYEVYGKTYEFKNHGLIRYATLECVVNDGNSVVMELKESEETLKRYPFAFTYRIAYTLEDNKLTVSYTIKNEDEKKMPFTFGLHPGFRVPLCENEVYEDYTLHFECEERLEQMICDPKRETSPYFIPVTMDKWNLSHDDFEKNPTLIYKGMKSEYVTLKGKEGHGVKMSLGNYPLLALWTPKRGAPFLCIEPWFSHADFEKLNIPFEERYGMMVLDSKEEFKTSYTIEVF